MSAAEPPLRNDLMPELHHTGLVVANLSQSMRSFSKVLGRDDFWTLDHMDIPPSQQTDDQVFQAGAVSIAMAWMGNTLLELICPLDEQTLFHQFLLERGEGLHHLGFWVRGMGAHVRRLEAEGMTRIAGDDSTAHGTGGWAYMSGDATSGAVVELIDRNEASEAWFDDIYRALGRA